MTSRLTQDMLEVILYAFYVDVYLITLKVTHNFYDEHENNVKQ